MARLIPMSAGNEPGAVAVFAMATPPRGWLKANGAAVSRSQYPRLFAAIGTIHGAGDGATTFNVPDLRGEFVRGLDDGRDVDPGRVMGAGQSDDNKSHSHGASTNSTGGHSHSGNAQSSGSHVHDLRTRTTGNAAAGAVNRSASDGTLAVGSGAVNSSGAHNHDLSINWESHHSHTVSVDNSGGAETRPRNVALLFCIKT